jgi:hypothetical protein
MAWMKNGLPDVSETGVQRLIVGVGWGALLLAVDPFGTGWMKAQEESLAHFLLVWPVLVTPFVLLAGLGQMRRRTLEIWAVAAALLAVLLVWHDIARQPPGRHPSPSPLLIPMSAVFFFLAHQLVAAGDAARRWIAPYETLFAQASRQFVQFGLSVAMTGAFWAVLGLGSGLFGLIGVKAFGQLIGQSWFVYLTTPVVFALAVQVADVRAGLIEGIRTLGLNLVSWLGPLLTLLCLAFLLFLPFTGLQPLWSTKAATPILLTAALVLAALINAAYQDGRRDPAPAVLLKLSARISAALLTPLVALAAYGTALRIGQYGLTPDRVIALAVLAVAAVLALGYLLAALLPGGWMKRLEPTNITALVLALGVLLALFTPLADPARLSVDSQVARLRKGLVKPDRFDFEFLARHGQRYGRAALDLLKRRPDQIGELARTADAPGRSEAPAPQFLSPQYVVYPKGAVLPPDFLSMRWRADEPGAPNCEAGGPLSCEAYLSDFDGDGAPEILVQVLINGHIYGPAQLYRREAGGWRYFARAAAPLCDEDLPALRRDGATVGAPAMRDLVVGGRRFGFQPEQACADRAR